MILAMALLKHCHSGSEPDNSVQGLIRPSTAPVTQILHSTLDGVAAGRKWTDVERA